MKEILALPARLDYDESMETTNGTGVKDMENTQDFDEMAEYIAGQIADMETAADAGDPIAIDALANGYTERMRLTDY